MSLYPGGVLFVCQTPLHLLLMLDISRLWSGDKAIVWVSESDADARLVGQASRLSRGDILCLPGGARIQSKPLRMLTRAMNVFRLRFFERGMRGQSLVIFNDLSPETQYLIEVFHASAGKVFLGEDGVATYPTGGVVRTGNISRLLGKLLYGLWWSPASKIGLNRKVSTVFSSYPSLIRSDVCYGKEVLPLPTFELEDIDSSFDCGLQNCLLCVMPLVSSVSEDGLRNFVETLRTERCELAIKMHPRESLAGKEFINSILHGRVCLNIPKDAPIEAICMRTQGIKEVVGHRSSALHMIKFLRPEVKVMYAEFRAEDDGEVWQDFYRRVGIVDFFEARGTS